MYREVKCVIIFEIKRIFILWSCR